MLIYIKIDLKIGHFLYDGFYCVLRVKTETKYLIEINHDSKKY